MKRMKRLCRMVWENQDGFGTLELVLLVCV